MTTTADDQRAGRNQALGAYGERVAARHLAAAGMVVLDRNWRCDEGELDLVLRDGSVLVVCEVKTRTSTAHGHPHEAISDDKLARLLRLGERWAQAHQVRPPETRVDLVAVLRPGKGPALVEHVRGLA
jgi:putative endonuclease